MYVGFLCGRALFIVPTLSVIPTLAHIRGSAPLNPVLVAYYRLERTQTNPLYLPEILVSEYALSLREPTNKPETPGFEPPDLRSHAGNAHCTHWSNQLEPLRQATDVAFLQDKNQCSMKNDFTI